MPSRPPHPAPHPRRWLSYLCLAASMALVGSYVGLSKVLVLVFPIFSRKGLQAFKALSQ